jgi:hypothetical protein
MTYVPDKFRIATLLLAVALGWFASATIFAETFTPNTKQFSQISPISNPASPGVLTDWAAAAAPLRGDLLSDIALARAVPAINQGKAPASPEIIATRESALATAKRSLSLAPHSSRMWLLVAILQNQRQTRGSGAEVLKMSYLTSPSDVNLIPTRLAIVAASAAITDPELQNLARGDIRLILTRRPDLKPAIISAYRNASPDGKAYLDEVVRSLDQGFAASLR